MTEENDMEPGTDAQVDERVKELKNKYWGGTPPMEKTSESLKILGAGSPYPQRNE